MSIYLISPFEPVIVGKRGIADLIHHITIGIMIVVQKSRFQVTKMLKMNIMKNSKINTELRIPLKFRLGSFVRLNIRFIIMGKLGNADFTLHFSLVNNQTTKLLRYFLVRQNDSCPEIEFSGQQNAEN